MSDAVIYYRFALPPERPIALPSGPGLKVDEGAPDGRLFPVELLARAYRVAVQRASRDNGFQYRDPRGSPALREATATMLKSQPGLPVAAATICITRGTQNKSDARPGGKGGVSTGKSWG